VKESGRTEEAIQSWELVLRLSLGDPTARRELIGAGRAAVLAGCRSAPPT
jgi:hypothetical protein